MGVTPLDESFGWSAGHLHADGTLGRPTPEGMRARNRGGNRWPRTHWFAAAVHARYPSAHRQSAVLALGRRSAVGTQHLWYRGVSLIAVASGLSRSGCDRHQCSTGAFSTIFRDQLLLEVRDGSSDTFGAISNPSETVSSIANNGSHFTSESLE